MTLQENLFEKLSIEYNYFIADLLDKPPGDILDAAYEKVIKADILYNFEGNELSDNETLALLAFEFPLDEMYLDWLDSDNSYMDVLRDSIDGTVARFIGGDVEAKTEPLETPNIIYSAVKQNNDNFITPQKTNAINGILHIDDWVIVKPGEDYGLLIGQITAIDKFGTSEHETENPDDDVHVDFTAANYPWERIKEIESQFSDLYAYPRTFNELPLDDVIISPDSLISLVGTDLDKTDELLSGYEIAKDWANTVLADYFAEREEDLIDRVEVNYSDYNKALSNFGTSELIDMAGKISAISDAYSYMTTSHGFSDAEIEFYLQFQNPLEVVADAWWERTIDLSDMSFAMDAIVERKETLLTQYPLIRDLGDIPDNELRRFMHVDIIDFLGKIAEQTIIYYPKDWDIDKDILHDAVSADDFDNKRFVWHVCSFGTHIQPEKDVFVRDSGAFNYMTDYRQNDPDMFGYVVEVTGKQGQNIIGNVFEVGDYTEYAQHIRDTALSLDTVTLTYSNNWGENAGRTIVLDIDEYHKNRDQLLSQTDKVNKTTFNHANESEMSALLQSERSKRMSLPIGSMELHIKKIAAKLAEIRAEPETPEQPKIAIVKPETQQSAPNGFIGKSLQAGLAKVKAYDEQHPKQPATSKKQEIE
jgi:hypothetical protein